MNPKTYCSLIVSLFSFQFSICQIDSSYERPAEMDTVYYLQNDTLFSNAGFYIYPGQELYLGKGSSPDSLYTTFGFKSPFAFPLWFMRETELKNNYEWGADPSKRERDKLQGTLWPGKPMVVIKIKQKKYRSGIYYYINFKDTEKLFSLKYRCSIVEAIKRGEVKFSK